MKKYGIGTGIFTLFFGLITWLSWMVFFAIKGGTVTDLGEFFAFLAIGIIFYALSFIVGIISGGLALLFGIITIVRIVKAIKSPKEPQQQSQQSEPKL